MDLSAVSRASILLLRIYEILLPVTQLLLPLHTVLPGSSFPFERSSGTPCFLVFFYSGSPSILPASFIPFMDSLQRSNYHPLLSFFRSSLPSLPRQHFLVSALPTLNPFLGSSHCHYHRNAHPSSSLKLRCITPFSFSTIPHSYAILVAAFPLLFHIQVDHILPRILSFNSGSAPNLPRAAINLVSVIVTIS
ncbi:hypothetical protein ILYODFUR_036709 [Ilyodon furcidens]|uniref:Uncharacterized protein n=1 Tax=Ilyodon furcidens TaxID=33524 RepID=A0ABV0UZG4_9TELE